MKVSIALALLSLCSCASHNSHHVVVDLEDDFDPLVDEAYGKLLEQWPRGQQEAQLGTRVQVEHVVVRWSPLEVAPGEPVPIIDQAAMGARVEQRLWQLMGGEPDPLAPHDYVVEADLETDLHDPEAILFGVSCKLARADKPDKALARGYSRLIQLPRLYCHGCNEAMGGHGSNLHAPDYDGGYADYGFWAGVGISCPPSGGGGGGYSKH